ncbi:hypothetical protein [Oligoflexus sp.]|uniref:hypothetical protein n=1 Tax=Oligoflexus sp. TaxID=1971216 RepID=UPI002D76E9DD|nr:hypothetical protein [Oligoflexus sp.]
MPKNKKEEIRKKDYSKRKHRACQKFFHAILWARGSLIGAAEWMAMILASWLMAGQAFNQSVGAGDPSGAKSVGAGVGIGTCCVKDPVKNPSSDLEL